VKNLLIR